MLSPAAPPVLHPSAQQQSFPAAQWAPGGSTSELSAALFGTTKAMLCDMQGYDHPEAVVEVWLRCLVAGQYFSDRLLLTIQSVEYHMDFWKARLQRGNNTIFLAIKRGPKKFGQAMAELARRALGHPARVSMQPTSRIEQRVRRHHSLVS